MTVRTFFLGLGASFGLAWLVLLVAPFDVLADQRPVPYDPDIDGREGTFPAGLRPHVAEGSRIYLQEGCAQCHTQINRPEYLGNDTHLPLTAGVDPAGTDARPTHPNDYLQVPYAPLGVQRLGQDLINVGVRRPDAAWHYLHLYQPRAVVEWSIMPGYEHLFKVVPIHGQRRAEALDLPAEFVPRDKDGNEMQVIPNARCRILVDYLLQLREDEPVPASELSPAVRRQMIDAANAK